MVNAVKVFKKTAPNGKITCYLGRRDFIDNTKEMELTSQQIFPAANDTPVNEVQDRLVKKLGGNAHPFVVTLPEMAPNSVVLRSDESAKPLGVLYELRVF